MTQLKITKAQEAALDAFLSRPATSSGLKRASVQAQKEEQNGKFFKALLVIKPILKAALPLIRLFNKKWADGIALFLSIADATDTGIEE